MPRGDADAKKGVEFLRSDPSGLKGYSLLRYRARVFIQMTLEINNVKYFFSNELGLVIRSQFIERKVQKNEFEIDKTGL